MFKKIILTAVFSSAFFLSFAVGRHKTSLPARAEAQACSPFHPACPPNDPYCC